MMSLPRLASPERKRTLKLLTWVASSSLPGLWVPALRGEVESTEKETLALLLQLQDPRDLANYYYKSEGCPRRQKKSKKTTVERILGKEKQQGSQDL